MAYKWGNLIRHDGCGNPAKRKKVFVYWSKHDYDEYKDASKAHGWEWKPEDLEDDTKMCIQKYRLWVKE